MKQIITIVTIVFILSSCTKDNSSSSGGGTGIITANIDGVNDTFRINMVDTITTAYGFYERGMEGTDANSSPNSIGVVIASAYPDPLTTGAYSENGTNTESRLVIQGGVGSYENNFSISNPLVVNVSSISPTAIHGTFYGTIFATLTDSLIVSNGKFDFTK